jgi:hypothetical protein
MVLKGTPVLLEEGRMVYGRRSHAHTELCVYHGGGGAGSKRIKVWHPIEGMLVRLREYCQELDGKDIDLTNVIVRKWQVVVPESMVVTVVEDKFKIDKLRDFSGTSKILHYANTPRSEWGKVDLKDLPPLKSRIANGGIITDDGVLVTTDWNNMVRMSTFKISDRIEVVDYDPATYGQNQRAITMDSLQKLVTLYNKAMGGGA